MSNLSSELQASILIALKDYGPQGIATLLALFNSSGELPVTREDVYNAAQELSKAGKIRLDQDANNQWRLQLVTRTKKLPKDIRKGDRVAFIAGSATFEVTFTRKLVGAWAGWYRIQYKQPEVPGGIAQQEIKNTEELEVEVVS